MAGMGCGGCGSAAVHEVETQQVAPDTQTVTLTAAAAEKTKEFMQQEGKQGWGLRIQVVPGGCAGFQYGLDFDESARKDDEVIEQEGLRIFVDAASVPYLRGTVIDFTESLQATGFKIINPNATKSCGCGNSFG